VPPRLEAGISTVWLAVIVVGVATVLLKATGPVLLGGRELPPHVNALVVLLAPAVLAALVVTQVVGGDRELVFDARLLGLGAGALAVVLRAPLLVVMVVAAATTAATRLLT
jgi:branched-subunit amino acid transport protein